MDTAPEDNGKVYYSIKEASEKVDENESTLRYWESEFPDMISPKRNEGKTRFYTKDDIDDIRLIKHLLRNKKWTLDGVREFLKNGNNREDAKNKVKLIAHLQNVKSELKKLAKSFDTVSPCT